MMTLTERLMDAIYRDETSEVAELIAYGADVDGRDEWGCYPLYVAIEHNRIAALRLLIAAGANVNRVGGGGFPIEHAVDRDSDESQACDGRMGETATERTAILLDAGAVPTQRAFELAAVWRNDQALALLRKFEPEGT